jgi:hypothetical protein
LLIERPNEGVSVAIFCSGDRRFGFQDGVNAAHWMASGRTVFNGFVLHTSVGDFCGYLEQIVVSNVSVSFRHLVSVAALRGVSSNGLMLLEREDGGRWRNRQALSLDAGKKLHGLIAEEKVMVTIFCNSEGRRSRKEL